MRPTRVTRWAGTISAGLAVTALAACQPETVAAGSTGSTGSTGSAPTTTSSRPAPPAGSAPPATSTRPAPAPSSSAAPAATAPRGPDGGSPEHHTSPNGVFGVGGGYLVDGSRVTFVYANGVRRTIDVGQKISDPVDAKITTAHGKLTLTADRATWSTAKGASVVDAHGAGTMVTADGVILVLPSGTATCANRSGLQFVGSNGAKGTASKGGLFYVDKSGKHTSLDRPGDGGKKAGQFTVCGIGDRVSMDLFSDVLFPFAKADLTAAGKAVIASAAATIKGDAHGKTVHVAGHTDSKGTAAVNKRLGLKRAKAVAAELKKAIPGLTVTVSSAGQTQPIAANTTPAGKDLPAGRAKNRRVTISYGR